MIQKKDDCTRLLHTLFSNLLLTLSSQNLGMADMVVERQLRFMRLSQNTQLFLRDITLACDSAPVPTFQLELNFGSKRLE